MFKQLIHLYKQYEIIIGAFTPNLKKLRWWIPGLLVGSLLTFLFIPTRFENNAEPVQLADNYKDQWIKAAAEINQTDPAEAQRMLEDGGILLEDVESLQQENAGTELATELEALKPVARQAEGAAQEQLDEYPDPGFFSNFIVPILWYILWIAVSIGAALYFTLWRLPGQIWISRRLFGESDQAKEARSKMEAEKQKKAERERLKGQQTAYEEPPVTQFMSTYMAGDNFYDDSFAIEPEGSNKFLGECGSGIAETIGVGDQKKVTATEVWMFAQKDIKTVTHILMTEHAYNDEALRAKLAARGEPVLAKPGTITVLKSKSLRAEVKVLDMEYGKGDPGPNSFFERLTVEIAIWEEEGASSDDDGGAGDLPPLPSLDVEFDPPPAMPSGTPVAPASSAPSSEPLKPPPMQQPPPQKQPVQPPPMQQPPPSGGGQPAQQPPAPPPPPPQQPQGGGQPPAPPPPPRPAQPSEGGQPQRRQPPPPPPPRGGPSNQPPRQPPPPSPYGDTSS